eukprot:s450_g7.t1
MPSGMPRDPGMAMAEGPPSGYEPCQGNERGGSMAAVSQLFTRLAQEIEDQKPKNCIHFVVDFLCKHYPEHLHGFASIWQMDPDLERERHEVVNFFKAHKISTAVAAHFTNAGYDTLDTLTTLSPDSLVDVEAFNNVKWLPGHKVRLQQIFSEISARVRAYRQQYGEGARQPRRHQPQQGQHHHAHAERRYDSDHGFHHQDSYQPRNHSPPRHEVHSYAGHGHALPHHAQAHQHDQRHVAFAGGFSGGYNGGFAPPQAVAPSMAPCPVTAWLGAMWRQRTRRREWPYLSRTSRGASDDAGRCGGTSHGRSGDETAAGLDPVTQHLLVESSATSSNRMRTLRK